MTARVAWALVVLVTVLLFCAATGPIDGAADGERGEQMEARP